MKEIELNSQSRYKETPVYEKDSKMFFGSWRKNVIPYSDFDSEITLSERHVGALDLLAHEVYEDASLWWAIASYNKILDPFYGYVAGDIMRIPDKDRVLSSING